VISVPMACVSLLLVAAAASAETYHVDCAAGSDGADGTAATRAWKTLEKPSAITFVPGDAVLLRRGTRCSGTLWPKGSGTARRPIRVGSYGDGPRPVIDAGSAPAALKLFNQQGWYLEDIETIGSSPHGIYIGGDAGPLAHFRVRNVVVTHVTGEPTTKYSGLLVVDGTPGAVMEDIVIDRVVAHHTTQWAGVIVVGPSHERRTRDVTVRNTVVHDVFGGGLFVGGMKVLTVSAALRAQLAGGRAPSGADAGCGLGTGRSHRSRLRDGPRTPRGHCRSHRGASQRVAESGWEALAR
jgi:hypothetical protein